MESSGDTRLTSAADDASASGRSFERYVARSPFAIALVRGAMHELVYVNDAFCVSDIAPNARPGAMIGDAFSGDALAQVPELTGLLDRVFRTGIAEREHPIGLLTDGGPRWLCTAWMVESLSGQMGSIVVELRVPTQPERVAALQRAVTGRMVVNALGERDDAERAEASDQRSSFLAAEDRRFTASLDQDATLAAISRTTLPRVGAWCIVDILEPGGGMRRLTMVHSEPAKQVLMGELQALGWTPEPGDPIGLPAMMADPHPMLVAGNDSPGLIATSSHDPRILKVLNAIGIGPLLVVPLLIGDELAGAITFIGHQGGPPYQREEVALAEGIANRSAAALDHARTHRETVMLKEQAEAASNAKSSFLGTMSHELRTPLNAIGGYVELLEMGLRGPITDEQRTDLERIKKNQRYLMSLITDVLNFVRVGNDRVPYEAVDIATHEIVEASIALVEPLIQQKQLTHQEVACDAGVVARADPDRVTQIMVNLLSNAIKFTPAGGRVDIRCDATPQTVALHISDTGMGIPPEMIESIFDPFVQVRAGLAGRDSGVGLGLAISRGLARAMHGDLTVVSTPGAGSRFTLTLPRAGV